MEGGRIGTDGNDLDVSISFLEPPKQRIQVQSPADDGDEEEELSTPRETGDSDDPITNLHVKIDALHLDRLNLQRSLASFAADFKGDFSRMQDALNLISSEAHNARAEAKKVLEEKKNDLKDFEGRMSDLKLKKESEAANFLKKEGELMMVVEELKSKAENSRISLMNKENEVNALTEALNMCKEDVEVVAKEKEAMVEVVAKEKEAMISLEEKLMVMRDRVDELIAERQKIGLAMEKKDEVIASITEELRIEREKGIDILEMKKNFGAAMTKKEDEIMSLNKDLLLAKENQVFENNMLEKELKLLNDDLSDLERTKKLLSGLTAAAIMTSIGTVAATITIFYLRRNRQG